MAYDIVLRNPGAKFGIVLASGGGGFTGTSATTQAAQTASASGTVVANLTGTSATTQAAQAASATGGLSYSGTAANTQAAQTASASGALTFSGSAVTTQEPQTASASGSVAENITGTSATTQSAQTGEANGITAANPTGTSNTTQPVQISVAYGDNGQITGVSVTIQAVQRHNFRGYCKRPKVVQYTPQSGGGGGSPMPDSFVNGFGQSPMMGPNPFRMPSLKSGFSKSPFRKVRMRKTNFSG